MPEISFQLPPFRLRETDTQRGKVACLMAQKADNILSSCFSGLNVACIVFPPNVWCSMKNWGDAL